MRMPSIRILLGTLLPIFLGCSAAVISNNAPPATYDVIIVGAGLTGMTAARHIQLIRPELSVLILEGRGMVGGRVRYSTMQTRNGVEFVDTGSQFISPYDTELLQMIQQLGVETADQLTCGENTLLQQRRKRSIDFSGTSFGDILASESYASNLTRISATALAQNEPIADIDSVNRLMQTFFDAPGEQVAGIQLALTCTSQNASAVEILRRFGHGDSLLAKGGMNEVVRRMADGLLIEYNQRIVSVNDATSPSIITTASGKTYSARQVILTVPIATLSSIELVPQPENPFQQLIQNYGTTGHAYYFTMSFQRATWRLNGKSGKVIYTSQNGPLVWLTTFDTTYAQSCANATNASSTLWGIAHFTYEVPFETRRRLYIQAITYSLRFSDFSPLDVSDVSFVNDNFARGTIPSLRLNVPFEALKYLNDYHTLYQNVHISSADISSISLGTMNGAIHAGRIVAEHVLSRRSNSPIDPTATQNGILLRDQPIETSTPYVYHTSSHYPPSMFETNNQTESPAVAQNVQSSNNAPVNNNNNNNSSTTFRYETSSQYPSTEAPTTTTMKHFSFGNLDSANETYVAEPPAILYDSQPAEQKPQNSSSFEYRTSSVMPPSQSIETTTFIHFSNGNLGQEQNQTQQNVTNLQNSNVQRDSVNPTTRTNYVYTTSTHYPIALSNTNLNSAATQLQNPPPPQVIADLKSVSDDAENVDSLQLASRLTSLVQTLLTGLRIQ